MGGLILVHVTGQNRYTKDPELEIEFRTGTTAHSINLVMKYKIFTTSIEKLEKNS